MSDTSDKDRVLRSIQDDIWNTRPSSDALFQQAACLMDASDSGNQVRLKALMAEFGYDMVNITNRRYRTIVKVRRKSDVEYIHITFTT